MSRRLQSVALLALGFVAGALAMRAVQVPPDWPSSVALALPHQQPAPRTYAPAVARAAPAVVQVLAARGGGAGAGGLSLGSGVIIAGDGLILTAHHVVADADGIIVALADGRRFSARLLGVDPPTDLALLRAAGQDLPAIAPGDPRALAAGDVVLALGHPFGQRQTPRLGIVSAAVPLTGLTGNDDLLQSDAPISPGDSGGALVDSGGLLLGILVGGVASDGGTAPMGLSVPADLALAVAGRLVHGAPDGWLGIAGEPLTPSLRERFGLRAPQGLFVAAVATDSPAAAADIRAGDVIVGVDGHSLEAPLDLAGHLGGLAPGRVLRLALLRGSNPLEATLTTAPAPRAGSGKED